MRYWLFQGNPARWRFFDYVRDHPEDDFSDTHWSCGRYRDVIRPGDRACLWMSGGAAVRGVYALGLVTGEPYQTVSGERYWTDPRDRRRLMWSIGLAFDRTFFDEPVLAADLRRDPRFARASILRTPRAANPHALTRPEWAVIAGSAPRVRRAARRARP